MGEGGRVLWLRQGGQRLGRGGDVLRLEKGPDRGAG